jgi:hypothetical protein
VVELELGHLSARTKALIDTGAPRCVFPRGIGDLLGLEFPTFPSDAPTRTKLMGQSWPAITETVHLLLRPFDDMGWEAEVDFVLEEGLPFALLGYEGFLNRWAVSFNGGYGYVVVEPADALDARLPDELFTELEQGWPGQPNR